MSVGIDLQSGCFGLTPLEAMAMLSCAFITEPPRLCPCDGGLRDGAPLDSRDRQQ